ncbi:GtrA family protein [Ornithinimicrobium sp. Y1694]|uniref:GtrA family protein n=1 Tax=Ornithinimicrobium sp. Y1694 TaxID=3418590 RepID=UPI003CEA5F0B
MIRSSRSLVARLRATYEAIAREFAKFGTIGAVAFVVDISLYNLLAFGLPGEGVGVLHAHPLTAKILATAVATVVAWLGNRFWTFRHRLSRPVPKELALFVLFNVLGLGIALACLGFSRYVLGLDSQLADNISGNGIGLVLGTLFRFWAYRTFVFRRELDAEEKLAAAQARRERRAARREVRAEGRGASRAGAAHDQVASTARDQGVSVSGR